MSLYGKNMYPRGFTLVELLVVIAIIGLLAGIVMYALNAARLRSRDAAIKAQSSQMHVQAEIFAQTSGSYSGTGTGGAEDSVNNCLDKTDPSFITKFLNGVFDPDVTGNINGLSAYAVHNKGTSNGPRIFCGADATRWAFAVPLNETTSTANGWCVDSTGASKTVLLDFNTPNSNFFSCP